MPSSEFKPVPPESDLKCSKCGNTRIEFSVWESYDGGHEDYNYRCLGCGRNWWVDGVDS